MCRSKSIGAERRLVVVWAWETDWRLNGQEGSDWEEGNILKVIPAMVHNLANLLKSFELYT